MRTNNLLALLLFCLSTAIAEGQQSKGRVSGTLLDIAEKKAISLATVNLYKGNQVAQPYKSTYTDAKGKFNFAAIDTGKYTIIFSHTGFTEKKRPVAVKGILELGTIELSRTAITLKGVNVLAQKPLVEQDEDKIIFNVENDPDSKTSTTLDIFRKTPYLSVDGEDNVQLNGQSNFKVLLNGRETSMFARNVKEALRAFPGTLISKIEIMTTPPAKYDAEGVGGIINIITKKKVKGYNGSLSTFNRTGDKVNNYNINFNMKTGKVGLAFFAFVGGYKNLKTRSFVETQSLTPGLFTKREVYDDRSNDNFFKGGNMELSFELDSLNTISTYGNLNGGNGSTITNRTMTTEFSSSPPSSSFQDVDNSYLNSGYSVGADYIKKFRKNKNREFSIRFYRESGKNRSTDDSRQDNPGTDRFLLNKSKSIDKQWTAQSDLVLPFPKNRKLESGMKFIVRNASSDFQSAVRYDPLLDYTIDPRNSDYFSYTQKVFSAYSTYSFRTKKTTFRSGGRLEFTAVDGDFVSSKTTVRQRYVNVVPFFQSVTKLNPVYTLVFTYTQRLRRPYIWNLNPFVNNTDSLDLWYGNPKLGPETVHFFTPELRYQKGSTFASLGFRVGYTNNYIVGYSTFDPSTGVTKRTSDHLGRGFEYRFNANLNTPLGKKLNIYANSSVNYDRNRVKSRPELSSDGVGASFNTGFTYKINPKITWAGNFNINRDAPFIQYRYPLNIWYVTMLNFKLFKDKVNLSVRGANLFNRDLDYRLVIEDQYFKTTRVTTRPVRGLVIAINWNFGKLKENVSKKKGVSNDDLINKSDDN